MSPESLHSNCFITCAYDSMSPYGRMVNAYDTLEEAKGHIRFQKERMGSIATWEIIHIKAMEWVK